MGGNNSTFVLMLNALFGCLIGGTGHKIALFITIKEVVERFVWIFVIHEYTRSTSKISHGAVGLTGFNVRKALIYLRVSFFQEKYP